MAKINRERAASRMAYKKVHRLHITVLRKLAYLQEYERMMEDNDYFKRNFLDFKDELIKDESPPDFKVKDEDLDL